MGSLITRAANSQLQFEHPTIDWTHFSFCQIAGPLERSWRFWEARNGGLSMRPT
jgi:proline racemase